MAKARKRSNGEISSPLRERAHRIKTLESQLDIITTRCQASDGQVPAAETELIAQTLDNRGHPFHEKPDFEAAKNLADVFSRSEPCPAQARGFYILADCVHVKPRDELRLRRLKQKAKRELGALYITNLLASISKGSHPEMISKSMAVFALELLENCQENCEVLRDSLQDILPNFYRCFLDTSNEMLRILIGCVLHRLLSHNMPFKLFFPDIDDPEPFEDFPCHRSQDAKWFASLAEHIEDLASKGLLPSKDSRSSMSKFASSFSLGSHRFNVQSQSVIIVTVSDFLNICIQTLPCDIVQCIEIPLHVIAHLKYTKSIQKEIHNEHCLEIRIQDSSEVNYFLNGKAFSDKAAEIHFSSETNEDSLQDLLQSTGIPFSVDSANADPPSMTSMTNMTLCPATATRFNTLASRVAPLRNSSQDLKKSDLQPEIQIDQHSQPEARHPADKERNGYGMDLSVPSMSAHSSKRTQGDEYSNNNTTRQRKEEGLDGVYSQVTTGFEGAPHTYHADSNLLPVEDLQNVQKAKQPQGAINKASSVGGAIFSKSALKPQDSENITKPQLTRKWSQASARSNSTVSRNGFRSHHADSPGSRRLTMQTGVRCDKRIHVDGADQDEWDVPETPCRLPNQMDGLLHASERGSGTRKFSKKDKGQAKASNERSEEVNGPKRSLEAKTRRPAAEYSSRKIQIMSDKGKVEDAEGKINNSASPSRKQETNTQTAKNRHRKVLASSNKAVSDSIESVEGAEASKDIPKVVGDTVIPAKLLQQDPIESNDHSQSPQGDAIMATEAAGNRSNKAAILVDRPGRNMVQSPSICGIRRRNSSTYAQEESPTLPVDGYPEGEQAKATDPDKAAICSGRYAGCNSRRRSDRRVGSMLQKPSLDPISVQSTSPLPSKMDTTGQNIVSGSTTKDVSLSQRSPANAFVRKRPTKLVNRIRTIPDIPDRVQKEVAFRIRSPSPDKEASPSRHRKTLQCKVIGRQHDPFTQRLKALSGYQNPFSRLVQPREGCISPIIAGDEETSKSSEPNEAIPPVQTTSFAGANLKLPDPEVLSGTPCSSRKRAASFEEGAKYNEKRVPWCSGTLETTPIAIPRKQSIISFSKSGPRNQGTSTNRYHRGPDSQVNMRFQCDDIGSFVPTQGDMTYSRVAQVAQMVEGDRKGSCSPIQSILHSESDDQEPQQVRMCSQKSRVTNEGSPMPFIYSRDKADLGLSSIPINYLQSHASVEEANPPSIHQEQTAVLPNATSNPSSKLVSLFTGPYSHHSYHKNRKQQPSSPREASEAPCFPVHHFDNSGVIFNPATEETIIPLQPLDPFLSDSRTSATSFIRMLRETGEDSRKRPAPESAPERPLKRIASHLEDIHEDLDKTLVASPSPLKDQDLSLSDSAAASEAGELESQDVNTRRTQIVQKHQQGIQSILSETTNRLLTRLVRSEGSFMNIVDDYQQSGNILVDQFHQNCQADVNSHKATADAIQIKVRNSYQETIEDLEITLENMKGQSEALEMALGKSQTSLDTMIDTTLTKFRTY